jgi:hypothetical protein
MFDPMQIAEAMEEASSTLPPSMSEFVDRLICDVGTKVVDKMCTEERQAAEAMHAAWVNQTMLALNNLTVNEKKQQYALLLLKSAVRYLQAFTRMEAHNAAAHAKEVEELLASMRAA